MNRRHLRRDESARLDALLNAPESAAPDAVAEVLAAARVAETSETSGLDAALAAFGSGAPAQREPRAGRAWRRVLATTLTTKAIVAGGAAVAAAASITVAATHSDRPARPGPGSSTSTAPASPSSSSPSSGSSSGASSSGASSSGAPSSPSRIASPTPSGLPTVLPTGSLPIVPSAPVVVPSATVSSTPRPDETSGTGPVPKPSRPDDGDRRSVQAPTPPSGPPSRP